ncbi:HdeD family acid-resistance protein [Crenothrix sp.]|uniref:HdeD family acid-resistance protein n=1 Tax=Crenothrix sp. TaxID=3100433 RepID=UPI00374D4E58
MKNADDIATELANVQQKMQEYMQKHWRLFLLEGSIFIVLGIAAVVIPQFFSVVSVLFLGWILVMGGAIHVGRALFFSEMPGFGLWLVLGILQIIVGYLLIVDPIAGVMTITMMMTLFFALEGAIKIYWAFMLRPLPNWNFVLFSGVTALLFAFIILAFWSETAHWLLGLFVGINMIILGWSIVKMSLSHKSDPV